LHVTNATAILVRRRRNAETHRTVTVAPEWGAGRRWGRSVSLPCNLSQPTRGRSLSASDSDVTPVVTVPGRVGAARGL
jgi:hypothetical protein